MAKTNDSNPKKARPKKRVRIAQSDVPSCDIETAMRVARAIRDQYANSPTRPMHVATAMGLSAGSSGFRTITGASVAYGMTKGGYNAETISLTDLGRRIVAPTVDGDDKLAMREAVLRPRVPREFLRRYDGHALPSKEVALNVLREDLGVHASRVDAAYDLIRQSAGFVGFVHRGVKGTEHIDLQAPAEPEPDEPAAPNVPDSQATQPVPTAELAPPEGRLGMPKMHLNLEIRIDASVTADQIDQIFASMARHLYSRDDAEQ